VGAWLSGAGPTVMCWVTGGSGDFFTQAPTERRDSEVADALRQVALDMGLEGNVYVSHVSHVGGCVIRAEPPFSTGVLIYNGKT
jgi:homoserine kinase